MLSAENLLAKLGELDTITRELLEEARKRRDLRTALAAVRESRGNVDSYARINLDSDLGARLEALEAALNEFTTTEQRGGDDAS